MLITQSAPSRRVFPPFVNLASSLRPCLILGTINRKFRQDSMYARLDGHVFRSTSPSFSAVSLPPCSLGKGSLGSVLTLLSPLSWSSIPQGAKRTVPTLAEPLAFVYPQNFSVTRSAYIFTTKPLN
mgnify:FL=1